MGPLQVVKLTSRHSRPTTTLETWASRSRASPRWRATSREGPRRGGRGRFWSGPWHRRSPIWQVCDLDGDGHTGLQELVELAVIPEPGPPCAPPGLLAWARARTALQDPALRTTAIYCKDAAAPLEYLIIQIDRWREGRISRVEPLQLRTVATRLSVAVNELVEAGGPADVDLEAIRGVFERFPGSANHALVIVYGVDDPRVRPLIDEGDKTVRHLEFYDLLLQEPADLRGKILFWVPRDSQGSALPRLGALGKPGRDEVVRLLREAREGKPADLTLRRQLVDCGIRLLEAFGDPRGRAFNLDDFGDAVSETTYHVSSYTESERRAGQFYPWRQASRAYYFMMGTGNMPMALHVFNVQRYLQSRRKAKRRQRP